MEGSFAFSCLALCLCDNSEECWPLTCPDVLRSHPPPNTSLSLPFPGVCGPCSTYARSCDAGFRGLTVSGLWVAVTVHLSPSELLRCWGAYSKVADGMLLRSGRPGCLKPGVLCTPQVGVCGPGRSWFPACLGRYVQVTFFANACLERCPEGQGFTSKSHSF